MHARHYNPQLGRFLQTDPLAVSARRPQSLNRYAYVAGNPVSAVDPLGTCEWILKTNWEMTVTPGGGSGPFPTSATWIQISACGAGSGAGGDGYPQPMIPYGTDHHPGPPHIPPPAPPPPPPPGPDPKPEPKGDPWTQAVLEEFRKPPECDKSFTDDGYWDRVADNFWQTNSVQGLLAPPGVGSLTAGTFASKFGRPTLIAWARGAVVEFKIYGTAIATGHALPAVAGVALLNAAMVGGAYEAGVLVGSMVNAGVCF